jgi:GTP cyclohydrolase II
MFLHLYQNSEDNKEHLAIVFGNGIRSKSLDRVREGETEMDRLIRGAYTGRLYPGRTSSKLSEKKGEIECQDGEQKKAAPLVRIHSECYTGETVWSARCDCGEQLDEAARLMSMPGSEGGIIIYLRQEGRGIGLGEKLKAYNLQDLGSDTVEANLLLRHPADARSYGLATAMLVDLGVQDIRLLTNNPDKVRAVEGPNREIVVKERVAMIPLAWRLGKNGTGGIRSEEVGGYLKTKVRGSAGGHDLHCIALVRLLTSTIDRENGTYAANGRGILNTPSSRDTIPNIPKQRSEQLGGARGAGMRGGVKIFYFQSVTFQKPGVITLTEFYGIMEMIKSLIYAGMTYYKRIFSLCTWYKANIDTIYLVEAAKSYNKYLSSLNPPGIYPLPTIHT